MSVKTNTTVLRIKVLRVQYIILIWYSLKSLVQAQAQPLYWFKTCQPNWISYLKTSGSFTYLYISCSTIAQSPLNPSFHLDEKYSLGSNPTMDLLKFKVLNNIASISSVNSQEFKHLTSAQMPHISSTLPFIAFNYFLISHQLWTAETWLKHSILASARSRTPSTVPQRKMEVWKFEHRLLTNSACEPSFWRVNDTWNKRAIVRKPAKNSFKLWYMGV